MTHPLDDLRLPGPTMVLVDDSDTIAPDAVRGLETVRGLDVEVVPVSALAGDRGGWRSVLVVAADRSRLRQLASVVPRLGRCRAVACWLTDTPVPWVLVPRPEWPVLSQLVARPAGDRGVLTVARFAGNARAQVVVMEMARQAAGPGETSHLGLVTGYVDRPAAPGLDARAVHAGSLDDAADADRDVPPDVVVAGPGTSGQVPAHHVIDRAPTLVTDAGPDPVDERVFNPVGFEKQWSKPLVDLADLARGPVTEDVVARARAHEGVRLPGEVSTPDLLALASAGVPLVARTAVTNPGLAPALLEALAIPPDLQDPLAREEHSLAVRRAAFDHHSTLAWRSWLAGRAGVPGVGLPPVSALLATKRPEMLDFALRQVARQRGAEVELVIAAHGFEPDAELVARVLGDRAHVVLSFAADTFFGDVLTAAARAASSRLVLKIDDDDWYAPDAVHDLLMARRFSGADLVGMPSEFVYLHQGDLTVRRNHPSEVFTRFVAGGTMMLDRSLLAEVGWFRRVRRFVDAQLLTAIEAAGGSIYRTHGLGYILRRTGQGHTWVRDSEEFRRPDIVDTEWSGFRPSRAMEVPEPDRSGREGE